MKIKQIVVNRKLKFEYGFESVNGTVKKHYFLHEIPNIKDKCDVWNVLPVKYVRQSIGIKDVNGVELFEGDIISYLGAIGVVVYEESTAMYMASFEHQRSRWSFDSMDEEIVIIGNIHDNQDILQDVVFGCR